MLSYHNKRRLLLLLLSIIIILFLSSRCQIAEKVGSRSGKQCRERYLNHLSPSINRSPWSIDEDKIIYKLHDIYHNNWCKYINDLPGRSDNSIKNRWHMLNRNKKKNITTIYRDDNDNDEKSHNFELINFYPYEAKVNGGILSSSSSVFSFSSSLSSSSSSSRKIASDHSISYRQSYASQFNSSNSIVLPSSSTATTLIPIVHNYSREPLFHYDEQGASSVVSSVSVETKTSLSASLPAALPQMPSDNGTLSPVNTDYSSNDDNKNTSTTNDFMNVFNDEEDEYHHYLHFHINDSSYGSNNNNLSADDVELDELFEWL